MEMGSCAVNVERVVCVLVLMIWTGNTLTPPQAVLLPAVGQAPVLLPPRVPVVATAIPAGSVGTNAVAGAAGLASTGGGGVGTVALTTLSTSSTLLPTTAVVPLTSTAQGSATLNGVGGTLSAGGVSSTQAGLAGASGVQTTSVSAQVPGASSGNLISLTAIEGNREGPPRLESKSDANFKSTEGPSTVSGTLVNRAATGK